METPAVLRKCKYAFLTLPNYSLIAVANALEPLRMANRLVGQEVYQWSVISMDGHAAEASSLGHEALAAIAPEDAGSLLFDLHPSRGLVRSAYPVVTIWAMNTGLKDLGPVDFESGGQDAFVLRPGAEVTVRALPPGAYEFIDALRLGQPLGDAAAVAMQAVTNFDLAANIRQLMSAGAMANCRLASVSNPLPRQETS